MKTPQRLLLVLILSAMTGGIAQAAGWMDSAASVASSLNSANTNNSTNHGNTTDTTSSTTNGTSLAALAGLLNGGDKTLSANSMNNAAGILQYCVKNNLLSAGSTSTVKDQLLTKLGIPTTNTTSTAATPAEATPASKSQQYLDGLSGLLNTRQGESINLNSLGTSQLTEKVKTKACDVVLKQGKNFIS